jgi:pimeloyl-ACP methyl ester carboxylesterase
MRGNSTVRSRFTHCSCEDVIADQSVYPKVISEAFVTLHPLYSPDDNLPNVSVRRNEILSAHRAQRSEVPTSPVLVFASTCRREELAGRVEDQRDKFYLYCRQNGFWPTQVTGRDPQTEDRWFEPYCPIRNVTPKYPPTMLIHGTADTDVPYSLSKDMDTTLGKAGVVHELITVDGAEHGLAGAKPEEVSRAAARAVEFVKAHTA